MGRRLLALALGGALLTACAQFRAPGSDECYLVQEAPAPMFHVGFVTPASAGATVSLEPWVFLSAPAVRMDELLPGTFKAQVNTETREILVTGRVKRSVVNPQANCAIPAIAVVPEAATLSLPVVLTATGTYTVRIASESFTTNRPPAQPRPDVPARTYPEPAATRSLVID